jgi:hypothetical protein
VHFGVSVLFRSMQERTADPEFRWRIHVRWFRKTVQQVGYCPMPRWWSSAANHLRLATLRGHAHATATVFLGNPQSFAYLSQEYKSGLLMLDSATELVVLVCIRCMQHPGPPVRSAWRSMASLVTSADCSCRSRSYRFMV